MMNKSKIEIFWTYMSRWNGKNPKTENMPPTAFPACFGIQGYSSLVKICDACGVTLSQFFLEDNEQAIHLTDRQSALLAASSKLTPEQYNALLAFLEQL